MKSKRYILETTKKRDDNVKQERINGLATLMLLGVMLSAMVMPAAALYTETAHASYKTTHWVGYNPEIVLGYYIPHDTLQFPLSGSGQYRPYVGGVNSWVVANIFDHNDPQKWDYYCRTQVNSQSDKLELKVPKSYALAMNAAQQFNWVNEISIRYYRR